MMLRMKTAWKVVVGILAALLVLLLVAEFGLRAYMAHEIRSDAAAQNPGGQSASAEQADVSFGPSPITLGLLRGTIPHMEMRTPSTLSVTGDTFTGQPAADIRVDNLRVAGGRQVAENFVLSTELPDDYVRVILEQQLSQSLQQAGSGRGSLLDGLLTISSVTSHPDNGTFTIGVSGGAADIELRPRMDGDRLTFEAASTELFGFQLPGNVTSGITDAIDKGMQDSVSGELAVRDFTVVDGGLKVTLAGQNVDMEKLAQAAPVASDGTGQPDAQRNAPQPAPAGSRR